MGEGGYNMPETIAEILRCHNGHCEEREARRSNLGPHMHEFVQLDCFAEFILGLAEGKTRGLAMTVTRTYPAK